MTLFYDGQPGPERREALNKLHEDFTQSYEHIDAVATHVDAVAAQVDEDAKASNDALMQSVSIAESIGPYVIRGTKSEADAKFEETPVGIVYVLKDETLGDCRTWYKKEVGATSLEFVVNLDKLRIDFTQPTGNEPAGGFSAYVKVRAYTGSATRIRIKDPTGTHWWVRRGTRADDGVLVLKDGLNRSWEREKFAGAVHVGWAGADPTASSTSAAINLAIAAAESRLGAGNRGMRVVFDAAQYYKLTSSLLIRKPEIEFYSAGRTNLDVSSLPVGEYAIDADLSAIVGGTLRPIYTHNVCIIDTSNAKTRRGVKGRYIQKGKFTNLHCVGLEWAFDPGDDFNCNIFENFRTESCKRGFYHVEDHGAANNNTFISPVFSTSEQPYYCPATNGNTILGGDFEPANGITGLPIITTGDREVWAGMRIERNLNGAEWLNVGSDCEITTAFNAIGDTQPLPAIKFRGSHSKVTVIRSMATELAHFLPGTVGNELVVKSHDPLLTRRWILDEGFNKVTTANGSGTVESNMPLRKTNIVSNDLTTYTASNMTVTTVGAEISLVGTGANPSLTKTITGTFPRIFVSIIGRISNPSGNLQIQIGNQIHTTSAFSETNRRSYFVFNFATPITNPILTIKMPVGVSGSGSRVVDFCVSKDVIGFGDANIIF